MAAYYPPLENLPTFDVKVFRDAQDVVDYSTTTSNIALTSDNSSGTYYIPFSKTTSTVSNALYIDNVTTPLTYDPATGTLSATNFSGSFPAPTTILVTDNNTATTYYPVFAATGTGQQSLFSDFTTTPLSYVPSTSTLTATTFSGSLSGTATNANNLLTTDTNTQIMYLLGSNNNTTNTGSIYKTTGSGGVGLYYQPNLGTLWTSNITLYEYGNSLNQSSISINSGVLEISNIGNTSPTITRFLNKNSAGTQRIVLTLNGNAGASTFDGNANTATTATNATNVNLTLDNSASTYYLTFASSGAGNKALLYDTTSTPLSYVPSTSTLTATNFSGLASNASQVNITSNNTAGTFYLVFASSIGTGQNSLQYDDATNPLSYVPSTSTLSCSSVTANLNGNASTASTATTSNNVALTSDNTAGTYYIPFSKTTSATSNTLYIDDVTTPLTYNPSTSTLTATNFNGTVTNSTNATNATNVNLTDNSLSSTVHYLTYATSGGGNKPLYYSYVSNQLSFQPDIGRLNSNDITCNTFDCLTTATFSTVDTITLKRTNGTLFIETGLIGSTIQLKPNSTLVLDVKTNGIDAYQSIDMKTNDITNATNITATTFNGDLNGNSSSTSNIALTSDNTVGTYYIPFSKTTSATSNALYIDNVTNPLTYNPNSSTLTCTTVTASLNGNASTASTATTSNNIALTSDNTAGTYYIPFSKTTSATSNALFIDDVTTPLTYDPSTSTLTASIFNGTVSTSSTSNNIALTSDNTAGTYYIPFSKTTSATSNALFIDNVTTPLTYDPSTSTLTASIFNGTVSTSSTSNNVALTSDNTAGTYYIPFSKTTSATSNALFIDNVTTPLTYDPSTSTLTATNFSGLASSSTTVAVADNNTATTMYPIFTTTGAGQKSLLFDITTSPLSYVPSTGLFNALQYSINGSVFAAGNNNSSLSQSSTILSLTNYSTSSSIQFNTYSATNILTNSATVTSTLFRTDVPIATDDSASGDRLSLQAITTGASWNPITVANGSLIYAKSSAVNTQSLSITIWSNTTNGIVLTPLYTLIGFGGTAAVPTTNITFTGTNTTLSGPAININNNNFNFGSVTTCSAGYGAGDATNLIISNSGVASTVFTTGRNTIIGQESGTTLVVGSAENTLIGWRAGPDCASSYQNTFVGSQTGFQSGSGGIGENNTCVGYGAGFGLSGSGRGNTLVGAGVASGITTGQNNSCYGINSGDNITTGSSNICIGVNATVPTATASNQICIGTTSETMYIRGGFNWRVGTQITANITLTAPLAQFYTVAMAAATQTITLPAPNATTLLGQRIMFKRKTNTTAFTLAAGAGTPFIPIASITAAATVAVAATVFQVELVCDGTNWCVVSQA